MDELYPSLTALAASIIIGLYCILYPLYDIYELKHEKPPVIVKTESSPEKKLSLLKSVCTYTYNPNLKEVCISIPQTDLGAFFKTLDDTFKTSQLSPVQAVVVPDKGGLLYVRFE